MITKEEIKLIASLSPDEIEGLDYIVLYEIIQKLCSESLYMIDRIDYQIGLLQNFDNVMKGLNKENKELYKRLK